MGRGSLAFLEFWELSIYVLVGYFSLVSFCKWSFIFTISWVELSSLNFDALLDKYIVIITKAVEVGRIRGQAVYKIESTEFLPLQERVLHV